jgi:hypothetical protein
VLQPQTLLPQPQLLPQPLPQQQNRMIRIRMIQRQLLPPPQLLKHIYFLTSLQLILCAARAGGECNQKSFKKIGVQQEVRDNLLT